MLSPFLLTALITPLILAAPAPNSASPAGSRWLGPYYSGPASSFPSMDAWVPDFNTLFDQQKPEMFKWGNVGEDVGRMWNAIKWAARDIGIQERVIICMIMQESSGDVGIKCGDNGRSCGLMQAWESPGFPGQHSLTQDQISSMVYAGATHFKGNLQSVGGGNDSATYYKALRMYNSGRVDESNLSNGFAGTASYVSDLANCLQGHGR